MIKMLEFRKTTISVLTCMLLLLIGSCCSKKKKTEYYGKKSQIVKKTTEVNSCSSERDGEEIWYDPSGHKISVTHYTNGVLDGKCIYFCDGSDTTVDSMHYVNGLINGFRTIRYCSTKSIKSVVEYKSGLIMNIIELNDINGNPLFPGNHRNGNGEFMKYDTNGDVSALIRVRNGKLNGYSVIFTNTGFVDSTYFESGISKLRNISFNTYEGAFD